MSLGLTDSQYYSDIADAIREKTGSEAALAPSEMSAAIGNITSGGGLPEFTETVIGTGTSDGATITFTSDYHDYPLLVIKTLNTDTGAVYDILVTPGLLDSVFNLPSHNEIVINEFYNNQYITCRKDSSTQWSRSTYYRNVRITEVSGLTCDYTITETEIYNKGEYNQQTRVITATGLLDYDMLMVASSLDEIQPNSIPIVKGFTSDGYQCLVTPYNNYCRVRVTDTEMSSAPYHYVSGIKFTPKTI